MSLVPADFGCDALRTVEYGDLKFLLLCWNRNTKDDTLRDGTRWMKNGEPFEFDYVEEKVVASGKTNEELEASAHEYLRLSKMTMEEYIQEICGSSSESAPARKDQ